MAARTKTARETERGAIHVAFRIEATLHHRSLAIDLVATLIKHVAGADVDFTNAITTAFGEAFNNIVIHGYRGRSDGVIDVEADLRADGMTLRLMDTGDAADFSAVAQPDLDALPEGGLGVFMMHALVDAITYHGGAPNVLSLTKRTSSAHDPKRDPK